MRVLSGIFAVLLLAWPGLVSGADKASKAEAVAMVKRAVALIQSQGKQAAYAAIADPANKSFHDRDLYIYIYDLQGVAVAHGNNPNMVGRSLIGLRDNERKLLVQEMIAVVKSQGSGWVDFKWPNPVTREVESKSGYVERAGDVLVGSGIYK